MDSVPDVSYTSTCLKPKANELTLLLDAYRVPFSTLLAKFSLRNDSFLAGILCETSVRLKSLLSVCSLTKNCLSVVLLEDGVAAVAVGFMLMFEFSESFESINLFFLS